MAHQGVSFEWGKTDNPRPVAEVLIEHLRLPRHVVLDAVQNGQVRVQGLVCNDPHQRVQPGEKVHWKPPRTPETTRGKRKSPVRISPLRIEELKPPTPIEIKVHFEDAHIVVVEKPAGLTTVRHKDEVAEKGARAKRYLPPTLVDLLPEHVKKRGGRIRAVHRLDKETSGLVILAWTPEAETNLGLQFRAHTIGRRYLALVRGQAKTETIETKLVEDRGDHRRGSSEDGTGQKAITHVTVVETFEKYSLIECRLETGRTHQVRIHLGERGTPLCGEQVYDRPLHGRPVPDISGASRPLLHSAFLAVDHPKTKQRLSWTCPLPSDMENILCKIRKGRV